MRMRRYWLGLLCGALIAGSASAGTLGISGNGLGAGWGLNWGSYDPFSPTVGNDGNIEFRYNTVSLNNSNFRSSAGAGDQDPSDITTPGYGGQNYDAEAIFYTFSGDLTGGYLSVAMFTGFNPNGESSGISSPSTFHAGDLFIDLGNDGGNDIAVAWALGEARSGSAWAFLGPLGPNGELNPYYDGSPGPNYAATSAPYRLNENYDSADAGSAPDPIQFNASDVRVAHTLVWNDHPDRQRWFYETRLYLDGSNFDLAALIGDPNNAAAPAGIGLHWTMECGNDYIDVSDNTPLTPVVPVPAAAPIALLGMGIVALVSRKRRNIDC